MGNFTPQTITALVGSAAALIASVYGVRKTRVDSGLVRVNTQGRIVEDQDRLIDNLNDEIRRLNAVRIDDAERIRKLEEERDDLRAELAHAWAAIRECQEELHTLPGKERRGRNAGRAPDGQRRRASDGGESG